MVCSQCHTPNFRDYKYCRECGTRLEPGDSHAPVDDHAEVEELLQHAFVQMDQGDTEKALGTVQAALARDPENPNAHSVLGLVYERQGKIQEAIHQFRVVLQLSPDSAADREKLQQLQARGGAREPGERPLNPWRLAIGSAALAGAATFGVGLFLMTNTPARARNTGALVPAGSQKPEASAAAPDSSAAPVTPAAPIRPTAFHPTPPAPHLMAPASRPLVSAPAAPAPMALTTGSFRREESRPTPPAPWTPRTGGATTGLQAARIGEVVPLARMEPTSAPQGPATSAAPQTGPESRPQSKPRVEPLEPDTGFIKIETGAAGATAGSGSPAAPAPAESPKPSISITFTPGGR